MQISSNIFDIVYQNPFSTQLKKNRAKVLIQDILGYMHMAHAFNLKALRKKALHKKWQALRRTANAHSPLFLNDNPLKEQLL